MHMLKWRKKKKSVMHIGRMASLSRTREMMNSLYFRQNISIIFFLLSLIIAINMCQCTVYFRNENARVSHRWVNLVIELIWAQRWWITSHVRIYSRWFDRAPYFVDTFKRFKTKTRSYLYWLPICHLIFISFSVEEILYGELTRNQVEWVFIYIYYTIQMTVKDRVVKTFYSILPGIFY
jgi:hypothetical protein